MKWWKSVREKHASADSTTCVLKFSDMTAFLLLKKKVKTEFKVYKGWAGRTKSTCWLGANI